MLGRRAFAVHERAARSRRHGGVRVRGPRAGDAVAGRAARADALDTVGPLGRPFPIPRTRRAACCSASATAARRCSRCGAAAERGCSTTTCLAAESADRVFGALSARRNGGARRSLLRRLVRRPGRGDRLMEQIIREARTDVIYACRARAGACGRSRRSRAGTTSPCRRRWTCPWPLPGPGVHGCVLPVTGTDGSPASSAPAWTARCSARPGPLGHMGTIPFDALGAPAGPVLHGIALCRRHAGQARPGRTAQPRALRGGLRRGGP